MTFGTFKVEVKRGPAPDSSKGQLGVAGAALAARRLAQAKEEEKIQSSLREAEAAAARAGKDTAAHKQALSVVAKLNAQLRAHKLVAQSQLQLLQEDPRKNSTTDATEFHAIIPINDYPQKARWRVTNKETMVQLIDMTGASVTNKGIYYESSKEPPPEGPPKLHLLIESNEERRVRALIFVYIPEQLLIIFFAGRTSCPRDQTTPHRSVSRRFASRDAEPNSNRRTIQCCIEMAFHASSVCSLFLFFLSSGLHMSRSRRIAAFDAIEWILIPTPFLSCCCIVSQVSSFIIL